MIIIPPFDIASLKQLRIIKIKNGIPLHDNNPLVPGTSESEPGVFESFIKGAVDHNVHKAEKGRISHILQVVTGIKPDVFAWQLSFHSQQERQKRFLIFRLHGFAAENGKPLNPGRSQSLQHFGFYIWSKRLPIIKIPGLGLEAARTAVTAAGYEQGHADAEAIGDVCFL